MLRHFEALGPGTFHRKVYRTIAYRAFMGALSKLGKYCGSAGVFLKHLKFPCAYIVFLLWPQYAGGVIVGCQFLWDLYGEWHYSSI